MKKITLFTLALYYVVATSSCKKDCGPDITRPALSADALQWVEVANKNPKFKITTYDSQGKITKVDTVQGTYTLTTEKKSELIDDCYTLYYMEYINGLSVPSGNLDFGAWLRLDNYPEKGYRATILDMDNINENSKLDTAFVNGKLYYNVYKGGGGGYTYYYSPKIGFIYKKTSVVLELIP